MEQTELNFYYQTLQKKMNDYFTQSIVLESKLQYQNDIITKQNEKITELTRDLSEYQSQIEHLDAKIKVLKEEADLKNTDITAKVKKVEETRKSKAPATKDDGGEF